MVAINLEESRFEKTVDGHTAVLDYRMRGEDKLVLTHTGVHDAIGGQGIGTELVETALAYAREHGLKVVPVCPFVAWYVREHPEVQDIVVTRG